MRIKKESSKYVKISLRNFEIFQRFPEYGKKSGEILPYSAQSEVHHWASGDFLFQIQNLPSGSLGIRRRKYPGYINVGAAENASKKGIFNMSKFLREISTYVKGSQNIVKKGEILPYSAQSELHHWAPGDFLFQVQNLPSGSLGIRRRKFPG